MEITSSPISTRSELRIRPAQPGDRAALEAIAAQIWDGDDYLPRVLDDWFNDPFDGFFVATLDERLVGVTKLTRLAPREWWMEGLRVDPAFQGRGVSRILHHFTINQARQHEGIVRFSTASLNEAVQRLAAETGFERVASFLPYAADPLDEPVARLQPLGAADAQRVRARLDASPIFARAQRSLEWDWTFYLLDEMRLRDRLRDGLVYGWLPDGHLAGVVIVNPADRDRWPGEPTLKIAALDAPADSLAAIAQDARRLAAALDRVHVQVKALDHPDVIPPLERAGFVREWEGEVWLYAREIDLTEHADVRSNHTPPELNAN